MGGTVERFKTEQVEQWNTEKIKWKGGIVERCINEQVEQGNGTDEIIGLKVELS